MRVDKTLHNQRHNSSGVKDFYTSISQLLATDSNNFERLTQLTKERILCLLGECLVHLKQAKLTFDHFSKLEFKLDHERWKKAQ